MMCLVKESCKFLGEVTIQGEQQTGAFGVLYSLALSLTGSVLIKMPTLRVPMLEGGPCEDLHRKGKIEENWKLTKKYSWELHREGGCL